MIHKPTHSEKDLKNKMHCINEPTPDFNEFGIPK